jgi:hypothetical protein
MQSAIRHARSLANTAAASLFADLRLGVEMFQSAERKRPAPRATQTRLSGQTTSVQSREASMSLPPGRIYDRP